MTRIEIYGEHEIPHGARTYMTEAYGALDDVVYAVWVDGRVDPSAWPKYLLGMFGNVVEVGRGWWLVLQ